jgi:gliding motility-associated-like protein
VPSNVTGGNLIIYASGDINDSYEVWDIFDETGVNIGSIGGSGAPCDILMISIPLSAVDLLAWSANGTITFDGIDVSGTDINTGLCGDDFMEMILEVCTSLDCNGSDITLMAEGVGSYTTVFNETFDGGIGSGWILPVLGELTNPCEPSFDGGDYLWLGTGIAGPRILTTDQLDVPCGGEICFYLDYGIQNDLPPCEGIDLANEGVSLEYSVDGGLTWIEIEYYGPSGVGNNLDDGGNDPQMTTWNQYCAAIPPGAFSTQTQFQWAQYGASGGDNDQWGIDNISITRFTYCDPYTYDWAHLPGTNDPTTDNTTINTTTTYIVTYSNTFETCIDSVTLTIPDGININAGVDTVICDGIGIIPLGGNPTAWGGGSGVFNYSWSPITDLDDPLSSNPNANPAVPTMYTLTVTDGNNCSNTDSVYVGIGNSPLIQTSSDTLICEGEILQLIASGANSYLWSPGGSLNVTDNDTVIGQPNSTTIYTVTGYSSTGCATAENIIVSVEQSPIVNAGADINLCDGQSVTLNATGGVGVTFSWDNGIADGVPFTPLSTQLYIVTGTSQTGCTGTDTILITVNPTPVLQVMDETVCEGQSVNLTASGASSYSWTPGTFLNQTVGSTVVSTPVTDIMYTVTGTSNMGCTASEDVYVTVLPTPIPIINGQMDYCTGTFSTLSTSIAYTNYAWTTGSTNPTINVTDADNPISVTVTNSFGCSATSANFFVTESNVITYNSTVEICQGDAVLIHGNMESSAGVYSQTYSPGGACDSTSNVTLVVHQAPVIDAGPDQFRCLGDGIILSGSGAAILNWDNGVTNNIEFFPGPGVVIYTVTGIDQFGCSSTDDVQVTVYDLPTVSAGIDQVFCEGEMITLSGTGAVSYVWDNNVLDGVAFNQSPGIETYQVVGTDVNGCTNTDNVLVTINPAPTVNAGADITSCEGDYQTLTATGADNYFWDNNVMQSTPFLPSIDTVYMVVGVDNNGCSDTDYVYIDVIELPLVSFSSDITTGCTPVSVLFTNNTIGSFTNCVWNISDGTELFGCQNAMYTFEDEGVFDVSLTLTDNTGCIGSSTIASYITASETPDVSFYPSEYLVSSISTEVNFENLSIGADSYVWNFGDGSTNSILYNPSHTFPDDEELTYEVVLVGTSNAGCSDSMSVFITVFEELIFYIPNTFTPDGDAFNEVFQPIFSSGYDPDDFVFRIYNRWGELVYESHDAQEGWDGRYGKNSRRIQDGTYVWKVELKSKLNDGHEIFTGHVNIIR